MTGLDVNTFLEKCGWGVAHQTPLPSDCSPRRYMRLQRTDKCPQTAMLMVCPDDQKLEEFCALSPVFNGLGLSAPEIYAVDHKAGVALIEDFGQSTYTACLARDAMLEAPLYALALEALIHLHRTYVAGENTCVPAYSWPLLEKELQIFLDYYPDFVGRPIKANAATQFLDLWRSAFETLPPLPETLVLRDFHVDNLFWLEARHGARACGLIDFQDAVMGSPLYDVVSLLEDARRDVSPALQDHLKARYAAAFPEWDPEILWAHYDAFGAQRSFKILGIFVRQAVLHGRPQYLPHLPRVKAWIEQDLKNPHLEKVRAWWAEFIG